MMFYDKWKNKSELEKEDTKSILAAKGILLKDIPKEDIIAIYVKGSFIRREMNKKSDVDTLTILKYSKHLKTLEKLKNKYRKSYEPNLEFAGYSLWELKTNKKSKFGKQDRAAPSRAVQHLEHYGLIYGKSIKKEDFFQGSDEKRFFSMVKTFRSLFLPNYEKGKIGFSDIIKQVFWLVENEQKFLGKNPPHSWRGLNNSIKERNHIIHDTMYLRENSTKDRKIRDKYLLKLDNYLKRWENKLK
jgi:predicted nucleotidyltransferase